MAPVAYRQLTIQSRLAAAEPAATKEPKADHPTWQTLPTLPVEAEAGEPVTQTAATEALAVAVAHQIPTVLEVLAQAARELAAETALMPVEQGTGPVAAEEK
jgi:hypothetical protein